MCQDLLCAAAPRLSRDASTNIACISERQAGGLSGSAQWHPALGVGAAAGCFAAAAAPAPPAASVSPPEPWQKRSILAD